MDCRSTWTNVDLPLRGFCGTRQRPNLQELLKTQICKMSLKNIVEKHLLHPPEEIEKKLAKSQMSRLMAINDVCGLRKYYLKPKTKTAH